MSDNILIAIAWPYANSEIHVGNITGSHLPGDIVARYHRLKGDRVLMVSGTDSHGTPISASTMVSWNSFKKPGSVTICIPALIRKIISRYRKVCS